MATAKTSLRRRQRSGQAVAGKLSEALSAEASPDSKCPICLDLFNNISYLDRCLHKFCFRCIHEWSKNKAECPLCKQPFSAIYHTIKSETDFKKFDLRPTDNGSFGSFGGERFRYRTTLTGAHREARRETQRRSGRTSPPPDNGVMFEGLAAAGAGAAPSSAERGLRRIVARLASWRRSEGREVQAQEMVRFRRALYRRGLRVKGVRDGGRCRDTTAEFYQRNPACLHRLVPWLKRELVVLYGAHGSLVNIVQHIIMSRITRYDMEDGAIQEELRPFLQGRTEHFLHEFISFARAPFNMEAYDRHAVYDLPALSTFSGGSSSSGDDDDGDGGDSVIAISEDEDGEGGAERGGDSAGLDPAADSASSGALSQAAWDDETPGPSYSTSSSEARRALLLSVRDSETDSSLEEGPAGPRGGGGVGGAVPGERGGGAPKQRKSLPPRIKADSSLAKADKGEDDGGFRAASDEDDCVIVGFVKPMSDRTPELVQLSSDSEESVLVGEEEEEEEEGGGKQEAPCLPQHIRFSSLSPPAAQEPPPGRADEGAEERGVSASGGRRDTRPSPSGSRRGASVKSDGGNERGDRHGRRRSPDRPGGKKPARSRSRERRERRRRRRRQEAEAASRSPDRRGSVTSDSTLSRGRRHSRSRSRDRSTRSPRDGGRDKRGDEYGGRAGRGDAAPYRHYSRERYGRAGPGHSDRRSCHSGSRRDSDRGSRSRSRSWSREPRRRDRRRSVSRSASPPPSGRKSRHEKPGGKRKYKTRHLEELPVGEEASKSSSRPEPGATPPPAAAAAAAKDKKKSREKKGRRCREKSQKRSRSLSIEIVYEGSPPAEGHARRHHRKKKKHKKKSRRHRSKERTGKHSPIVITIDSDSDHRANDDANTTCCSPPIRATVTGNPADSSLLESMLQTWEKQIPPVAPDDGAAGQQAEFTSAARTPDEKNPLEHFNNVPRTKKEAQSRPALKDEVMNTSSLTDRQNHISPQYQSFL